MRFRLDLDMPTWAAVLIVFLLCAAAVSIARAAPPPGADPDSPVGRWFRSLTVPGEGTSCCNEADCRVRAVRPASASPSGWQVRALPADDLSEAWIDVPPEAISERTDNPIGATVTCIWGGRVRCLFWGGAV